MESTEKEVKLFLRHVKNYSVLLIKEESYNDVEVIVFIFQIGKDQKV